MNDTLKQNIERMENDLAEMKRALEQMGRNWPERLEKGMLFRHSTGVYMIRRDGAGKMDLVDLTYCPGNSWSTGKLFNGDEKEFIYIGKAEDKLRILD